MVPLHEFLRSITYVDHEYYSPQASVILNLFDISMPDGKEHFLIPIILAQMLRWAQNSVLDGYVHISDIYSYLQALGYHPFQIGRALERLLYRNLLESPAKEPRLTDTSAERDPESASYHRIPTVGAYYVKRLISPFAYLDAVVVDTPILDPAVRDQINSEFIIHERLERAKVFAEYLDSQWQLLFDYELPFRWPAVRRLIDKDIVYVLGKTAK